MFERLDPVPTGLIQFWFEGQAIPAEPGETVAAALLAANVGSLGVRPADGSPRAPYCMMGVCFDCLVEIDSVANRQACLVPVADGMRVRRQTPL